MCGRGCANYCKHQTNEQLTIESANEQVLILETQGNHLSCELYLAHTVAALHNTVVACISF